LGKLAESLKQAGYQLFTNVNDNEDAVKGTQRIFVEYEKLQAYLDNIDVFIGVRNGLCDIISNIQNITKIYLYPDVYWLDKKRGGLEFAKSLDVFSLSDISKGRYQEYVWGEDESELIKRIIDYLNSVTNIHNIELK